MDQFKSILKVVFKKLSVDLGVAESFIVDLHDEENSWSFISKLAQLIEGVFIKVLVRRLNEPEIFNTISNLPQSVRINFAHDLKIISRDQKYLFLTVAEIRNDYIHNVSNVGLSMSDYFSSLKEARVKEIFKRFKPFILDEKILTPNNFLSDCTNQIFFVCASEISRMYGRVEGIEAERRHNSFRSEQAEKLLPKKINGTMYLEDRMVVYNYIKIAREILKKNGLLSSVSCAKN
ncbi:hypothetical protein [Chromobacterium alticapitis]|uniref:Uncharacterized protein n=1 Tax=Chromobacterium alticapitis TaxID=2073169 RepID=A0A2S5DB86_9NEIS|nr:hypothetical protein [Chromobacterium alticapitis]POZ60261.1 hypothetical protein C2I19_19830 [Chromobacterium alticapitis]